MVKEDLFGNIYKNRKILVTGHTGFKGSWLSMILSWLGADVYGYALKPNTDPNLFELAKLDQVVKSTIGDIRDFDKLSGTLEKIQPEIIIHLAAQPLVIESYRNPRETYEVNVMGTVNILEASRFTKNVRVILNVTTDKCYENKEWLWGYREYEPMGGYDPYSNSKGCSELVTSSFRNSFFNTKDYSKHHISVATARAGNVIGGGDWASNRLIPDFFRSICTGTMAKIRNPQAIRPWQHVMEPLSGYLLLCERLYSCGPEFAEAWNFGPEDSDAKNVKWIINKLCELWGDNSNFELDQNPTPHEANYLKLDCSKAKTLLNWNPKWDISTSLQKIVDWNKEFVRNSNMRQVCLDQIEEYFFNTGIINIK
jgi:CDP-glucose 4,6-dehydratase